MNVDNEIATQIINNAEAQSYFTLFVCLVSFFVSMFPILAAYRRISDGDESLECVVLSMFALVFVVVAITAVVTSIVTVKAIIEIKTAPSVVVMRLIRDTKSP